VFILVLVVPFELGNISKPFLIRLVCSELAVKDVLCDELRVVRLTSATMVSVLDRGLDVSGSADPECPLVIDLDAVLAIQIIIDPSVSLGWILSVDLLHLFGYEYILSDSFADIAAPPLVIC
jgi:hypothetical protein